MNPTQWLSKGFQTVWQDWDLKLDPYQDLRFKRGSIIIQKMIIYWNILILTIL